LLSPLYEIFFEIYGDVGLAITYNFWLRFFYPCTYYPSVTMILLIDG